MSKETDSKENKYKTLDNIKHILNNCAPGKEAEAILFAIQFNKITGVTWSK